MDGMPHIFFWGYVQEAYSIQIGTLQIVLSLQELGPAAGSGQREKKLTLMTDFRGTHMQNFRILFPVRILSK